MTTCGATAIPSGTKKHVLPQPAYLSLIHISLKYSKRIAFNNGNVYLLNPQGVYLADPAANSPARDERASLCPMLLSRLQRLPTIMGLSGQPKSTAFEKHNGLCLSSMSVSGNISIFRTSISLTRPGHRDQLPTRGSILFHGIPSLFQKGYTRQVCI